MGIRVLFPLHFGGRFSLNPNSGNSIDQRDYSGLPIKNPSQNPRHSVFLFHGGEGYRKKEPGVFS